MILVDSNVLLDLATDVSEWADWSDGALKTARRRGAVAINPLVYAEVSVGFRRLEEVDDFVPEALYRRLPLPWEAAFLAGKVFAQYRRRGGRKYSPLPDFYIGAHASVARIPLLTRDPRRYRTYFPKLTLICPE